MRIQMTEHVNFNGTARQLRSSASPISNSSQILGQAQKILATASIRKFTVSISTKCWSFIASSLFEINFITKRNDYYNVTEDISGGRR